MNIKQVILASIITLLTLTGCAQKDENTWYVGTSSDNPPYEFMEKGVLKGFDIDLANAIAAHLGKEIEFKNFDFHGLLAALSSNNLDMVVAGMSITRERQARIDFSTPYTEANIAILSKKTHQFNDASDLNGKMVGSQLGTIWSFVAHDLSAKHHFKTKALSNNLILIEELKTSRIDAVILETFQAEEFSKKYDTLTYFEVQGYGSSLAVALPKNSDNLKDINHAIKALKNDGTIAALERKWGIK